MPTSSLFGAATLAAALLAPAGAALAQAPVINTVLPRANAVAASATTALTVTFSQPLTAGSAGALQVFSAQVGGRRTRSTPAIVNGNSLTVPASAIPYLPGETLRYTVTTAATGSGGALATPRVGQFTVAATGTGTGRYQTGTSFAAGLSVTDVVLGDIDGDGDLDLLAANYGSRTVSVRRNGGGGNFGAAVDVAVGGQPGGLALGDVDGDGDLDLLTANADSPGTVSVRVNDGTGNFGGTQSVGVGGRSRSLALGDLDGDGDLDLATSSENGTASVCLNNGQGMFTATQTLTVGSIPSGVALGDADGDGDLDLFVTNSYNVPATVSVRLNSGAASFGGGQEVAVGDFPEGLALGDVDADGDLDLVTANGSVNTVTVCLNTGASGAYVASATVPVGTSPARVALADVDSDGDLDLLTADYAGTVSVRLNAGGTFSGTHSVAVAGATVGLALGDVDGDGDLDFVTAGSGPMGTVAGTLTLRLNDRVLATATGPPAAAFSLAPNPARTGTVLSGAMPLAPVVVLDALGRTVLTATADAGGTARLPLPAGLYVVRSGSQACRLVVE